MDVMRSTCVGCNFRIDGKVEAYLLYAARMVVFIVAEELVQSATVSFIDIKQNVFAVQNVIRPRKSFFMLMVVEVQKKNLNGLINVFKH